VTAGEGGMAAEPEYDLDALRTSIAQASARVGDLVRTAPAGTAIPRSDWTVADVAAHLTAIGSVYGAYLQGEKAALLDVSDIAGGSLAASNARFLSGIAERDPKVLARQIATGTDAVIELTAGMQANDEMPWHGISIPITAGLVIALAEFLIHGLDIAKAVGAPWPITSDDARLVLVSAACVIPIMVDRTTAANLDATYDIHLRGGGRIGMQFQDGTLTTDRTGLSAADCRVNADAVAFLLIFYGRMSLWNGIARGKVLAYGRRPWLGLGLKRMFATP
jgi:uncharacterized protein (TIGR03083 family)